MLCRLYGGTKLRQQGPIGHKGCIFLSSISRNNIMDILFYFYSIFPTVIEVESLFQARRYVLSTESRLLITIEILLN